MSRKRRHFQAFPVHEDDDDHEPIDLNGDNKSSYSQESGQRDAIEKLEKEPEIWDAFREEHYEAIEQLPLSLHRQFILMKELDQQAYGYSSDLLPTLRKYISLRQSMVSHHGLQFSETFSAPQPSISVHATSLVAAPRTPTPTSILPEGVESPRTTREMLSRIGRLSEELLRASEEKVNLAQAGYNSVDRHIRLLDQAIKEQEASISLGTHLPPILLPDLVVPRWARSSRVTLSPMPTISGEGDGESNEDARPVQNISHKKPTLPVASLDGPGGPRVQPQKKGKKGRGKWIRKKVEQDVDVPEPPRRGVRSLKLTVSTPAVPPPGDPNEPRYCYCNDVSHGQMIGCDAKGCKREWFHLVCVGLTKAPSNNWYCQDCSVVVGRRGRWK